ncbi:MAG: prenyltransferase [Kiritimatiellae bacterium]|nr:prenyltransferase [Kiritimatiellia bacterium]
MGSNLLAVLISMRGRFLLLAAVCSVLGAALARVEGGASSWLDAAVVLIGALCAHAAVNMLNDVCDFRSGLDRLTRRTPFSGGSGALPLRPQAEGSVLFFGLFFILVTVLCGVWFLWRGRWGVIPFGLLGLFLIAAYTPWITRHPLLCLITPGLAFGPLITGGACYALGGVFSWRVAVVALVPFFLVNDLLLLNQFPDVEADRAVGRVTLPIWLGYRVSSEIYLFFHMAAFLVIGGAVAGGLLPGCSLWSYALVPLVLFSYAGARRYTASGKPLHAAMACNVLINLLAPAWLAVCLLMQ